jgi:hypothetical protein
LASTLHTCGFRADHLSRLQVRYVLQRFRVDHQACLLWGRVTVWRYGDMIPRPASSCGTGCRSGVSWLRPSKGWTAQLKTQITAMSTFDLHLACLGSHRILLQSKPADNRSSLQVQWLISLDQALRPRAVDQRQRRDLGCPSRNSASQGDRVDRLEKATFEYVGPLSPLYRELELILAEAGMLISIL